MFLMFRKIKLALINSSFDGELMKRVFAEDHDLVYQLPENWLYRLY